MKFLRANHPETDEQTKKINHLLKEYLRLYVTASQRNWIELLDSTAQFCYNLQRSSAIENSLFELVLGIQPNMPLEVTKSESYGKCPVAYKYERDK